MNRWPLIITSFLLGLGLDALAIIAITGHGFFGAHALAEYGLWHGLAVIAVAAGAVGALPPTYKQSRWTLLALILGFCGMLPLCGALFLAGFCLLFRDKPKEDTSKNYYFGERQVLTLERFEEVGRNAPKSFLEVLSGRDGDLRRKAILALRNVDVKKALPVLQKAIQDGDDQVRLLAQTQFNKIIAGLELTVKSMETGLANSNREPDDLVQLAEQYHELVFLGLSSEETETIYLDRALELLREAVKRAPTNHPARFLLLKCLVKRERVIEACECMEALRKDGFRAEFLVPWESEIHFQERNWPLLRESLGEMLNSRSTDNRLRNQLDFWMQPDAVV